MIQLKVEGMSCGHCEMAVKRALSKVPGVENVVEVSHKKSEVKVEGQPKVDDLITAIEAEGYQAEVRE